MLKNFNDFASLVSLIIITVFGIKFSFGLLFAGGAKIDNTSRVSLLKDYINNEDE